MIANFTRLSSRWAFVAMVAWPVCLGNSAAVHAQAAAAATSPAVHPDVLAFSKPVETADADDELLKKRKERHNAAVALLDERVAEYKAGSREMGVVFEAARLVAEAKLDLAETPEARVEALELTLKIAKLIESLLQQQVDKGFGSKGDLARAKHARLSVEVELLKAKGK